MASIIPQTARSRLDTGSVVQYPSGSPVGAAVAGFGNALEGVASRLQQKQEQKDNFDLTIRENEFAADLARIEDEAVQNAAADGSGLHDSVYGQIDPVTKQAVKPGSFDQVFDNYLQRVPENKRQEFQAKKDVYRLRGSARLAQQQYSSEQAYYKVEIQKTQNDITTAMAMADPNDDQTFEAFKSQGLDIIERSGLPALEKDVARDNWLANADETLFKTKLSKDPAFAESARMALGLAPVTPEGNILDAIQGVESEGNPNAVSGAGASGLMQVMPETAPEIASELGDANFPAGGTREQIQAYLKDPDVSRQYGAHYYNKMLSRYKGDEEAALVAYNGGPARADEWLANGRNDAVLPRETREYYKKVIKRAGKAQDFPIITRQGAGRASTPDLDGVDPAVISNFKRLQGVVGQSLPVVSGLRDERRNRLAKGAKASQHIEGNALDLDVSGMPKEKRIEIIRAASAMGFTGIGVYENSIHIDIGARRSWGPSHKSDSIPEWAKGVVGEHLSGKAKIEGRAQPDPRYANIPLERRLVLANQADVQVNEQRTAAVALQKAEYASYKDSLELQVVQGQVQDEQLISRDTVLNDGDKATLIRSFRSQNETQLQVQSDLTALAGESLRLDPYGAKDKTRADNLYSAAAKNLSPEQASAVASTIIQQTGVIPQPVLNDMRRGLSSTSIPDVLAAAQAAQRISSYDPAVLARRDGGGDVQKAADDFSYLVNKLNMTPEEAAQRLIDNRSPEKQFARKALEPAAKEFVKKVETEDLAAVFDESMIPFNDPQLGVNPAQEAGIKAEFIAIAEDQFYQANGDPDLARNRAVEQMKRLYGVTEIGGAKTVMKHPPERYWPKLPEAGFLGFEGDPLGYAKKQLQEDISSFGSEVAAGSVTLVTTPETDAMVKRGELPAYAVLYKDSNGVYQTIPGKLWRPDVNPDSVQAKADQEAQDQASRMDNARFQQEIDRGRAETQALPDGGREQSMDAFLAGPPQIPGPITAEPPQTDPTLQDNLNDRRDELFDNANISKSGRLKPPLAVKGDRVR